jgi:hypothetical protein
MPKHGLQGEETPLLKTDAYGRKSIAHTVSSFLQEAIGSERQHELQKVWSAAHLVRDAFIGETAEPYDSWFDPYARPENQFKNYYAILCCHLEARLAWPISVAMWALVLLSFIEPPYWCRGLDIETDHAFGSCGAVLNAHDPTDEKLSYYPNFDVMLLTVQQAHTIQLVFIAVLFFRLLVRIGRNGFELLRFFYPGVRYVNSLRCLMLVLMIFERTSMYHPFFRLILLGTYLTSCQREMRTLIELVSRRFVRWRTPSKKRLISNKYDSFQQFSTSWRLLAFSLVSIHSWEYFYLMLQNKDNETFPIGWRAYGHFGFVSPLQTIRMVRKLCRLVLLIKPSSY